MKNINSSWWKPQLVSEMSLALQLSPFSGSTIIELINWCDDYDKRCKYPANLLNRFAIGFYQIHQGIEWKDCGPNKYESFAASVMHLVMVGTKLRLPLEIHLPIEMAQIVEVSLELTSLSLLSNLSGVQQQLFYANKPNKTSRKSRYSEEKLTKKLGIAVGILIQAIPNRFRSECFYEASRIMTKEL